VRLVRKSKRNNQQLKNQSDIRWVAVNGKWSQDRLEKAIANLKLIKKAIDFRMRNYRIVDEIRKLEISEKKGDNFYKHMKKNAKKNTNIFPVKDKNGILQTETIDIVETFNEYLGETLSPGDPVNVEWETEKYTVNNAGEWIRVTKPSIHPEGPSDTLNQIYISPEAVKNKY
jgi:glutathione peroxidase-family protein